MKSPATNSKPTAETAAAAYARSAGDIARLLDVLRMELEAHAARAAEQPRNWGFAGDLGKVRSDLIELVGAMSGKNRHDIERFLDDARA